MRRSQVAFIRGAWTAVRRILVPVAWKTASEEAVKFEPLAEGEGEVAGLLHRPVTGVMGGDAAEVHPAGSVLDEHQDGPTGASLPDYADTPRASQPPDGGLGLVWVSLRRSQLTAR
jgi:hypothetical protein